MIHPLFHPTTAILVDENKTFLSALSRKLNEDTVYQLFDDPAQAMAYCLEKSHASMRARSGAKAIETVLLNPHRFDMVSVVILDCSMPTQFIDQLKENIDTQLTKIIMVTDEAGQSMAIDLRTAKKIEKFFLKNEAALEAKINNAIAEMQQIYFADVGQGIFSAVRGKMPPILNDAVFADFFSKIIQKLKICEYYFCDNTDSFILVDKEGISHILAVRSKSDLVLSAEYAHTQQVYSELVNRISSGRLIPFFGNVDLISAKMEDWIINTHRAKNIEGTEDYCYTLIAAKKTGVLPYIQNITGFAAYRKQHAQ